MSEQSQQVDLDIDLEGAEEAVVYLDETKYPIIRFTPAIKSMNYIGNMLSKRDCDKQGGYEPIFYNNNRFTINPTIRPRIWRCTIINSTTKSYSITPSSFN